MNQIQELFKDAILKRDNMMYINAEPIKKIFQLQLELPERKKYEKYLNHAVGTEKMLSVSEVYYYLKKFHQIHPTNITQIMFQKFVKIFKEKNEKSLFSGIFSFLFIIVGLKKYPNEAMNKFSQYIRSYGLDLSNILEGKNFAKKEDFLQYLLNLPIRLTLFQAESIINELDPFKTKKIMLKSLTELFKDELHFFNLTNINKPREIIHEIRTKIIPHKKLQLQRALADVDSFGDGFINSREFLKAFEIVEMKMDRQLLQTLFDSMSERFSKRETEKVLSISYFTKKFLSEQENEDFAEIDRIISKIKASLTYRGINSEIIFAEASTEDFTACESTSKTLPELTSLDFSLRLEKLSISNLESSEIEKLRNYLSQSSGGQQQHSKQQKDRISLECFLHHMKSPHLTTTPPLESKKLLLQILTSKLLTNETLFVKLCSEFSSPPPDSLDTFSPYNQMEGYLTPSNLRAILAHFSVHWHHASFFIHAYMNNQSIHLEDLLLSMKDRLKVQETLKHVLFQPDSHVDLSAAKIDYFAKMREVLAKQSYSVNFLTKMQSFDAFNTGKIKLYHLIRILKHNTQGELDEMTLAGIEHQLGILHPDHSVDYNEFNEIYIKQNLQAHFDSPTRNYQRKCFQALVIKIGECKEPN